MNREKEVPTAPISADSSRALKRLGELLTRALPDVRQGQIWRATWDGVTAAGVILDTDEDDTLAEFAPFTVDTEYADPYTGIVAEPDSPLGVDLAVFTGLTTPVPLFTLDRWLGALSDPITENLHSLWRANLAGLAPKDPDIGTGSPDLDAADPRRDYRNTLRADTAHIQAAELVEDTSHARVDLPGRLTAAGLAPSDLVTDAIGLSYARQAAEGNAAVTSDVAARIAELLGEPDPDTFVTDGPALPPALAACLTTPRRFSIVREIMYSEDLNEVAAARRIPAIVKFRRINQRDDETEHEFWEHALDMLRAAQ